MAKDMNKAIVALYAEMGQMTENEANVCVKTLRDTGRYQEDVW